MVQPMIKYKITISTDENKSVNFFTYNAYDILDNSDELSNANNINIFIPENFDIIKVNNSGIFVGHKNENQQKENFEDKLLEWF